MLLHKIIIPEFSDLKHNVYYTFCLSEICVHPLLQYLSHAPLKVLAWALVTSGLSRRWIYSKFTHVVVGTI